jgi:hypothetical protein
MNIPIKSDHCQNRKGVKKLKKRKPSSPNKRRKTPFPPRADEMILEELIRIELDELNKKRVDDKKMHSPTKNTETQIQAASFTPETETIPAPSIKSVKKSLN